jgi:hypothetical protein
MNIDNNLIKEYKYNCEKCNYKCQFECQWIKHCDTVLHKTGERKKKDNYKQPQKCKECDYITKNTALMKKHILNEHSKKEEREKGFKYYCSYCDFGTFSKVTIETHNNTNKHKNFISILEINKNQ